MKTTKFFAAVLALTAGLSMASAVIAAPILNLYYDPANGNLKLQNTTSGSQSFQSVDIITLGNGTLGAVSGQPGNVGFLSTGTANLPTSSFPFSNTNPNGYNGLYSQAAALNVGSAMLSLSPYAGWSEANPIGPVGSYWDLGNIAITGMTQADLDARFLTDPEGTPPNFDTTSYGQFLFSYQTGPTTFSVTTPGNVVSLAAVPEPSTIALAAVAAVIGGVGAVSKRRKNAKRLSTNA